MRTSIPSSAKYSVSKRDPEGEELEVAHLRDGYLDLDLAGLEGRGFGRGAGREADPHEHRRADEERGGSAPLNPLKREDRRVSMAVATVALSPCRMVNRPLRRGAR